MIGLAGAPREPSAVWQAAQTWVEIAWPLARSGFAAGAGVAAIVRLETKVRAPSSRVRAIMGRGQSLGGRRRGAKTREFYNAA